MRGGRYLLLAAALLAALGIGYALYWRQVAAAVEADLHAFAAAQKAAGRLAQFELASIAGFPFWIEIALKDAFLADAPEALGWLVAAPRVGARARPWSLGQVRVSVPEDGVLRGEWQAGAWVVEATGAVLDLDLGPGGAPRALALVAPGATVGAGSTVAVADLSLNARVDAPGDALDATLLGARLTPLPGLTPPFDGPITGAALAVRLSALSRLGGHAPEAWREAGGRLRVQGFRARWGALELEAMGEVGLDAEQRPEGRLDLQGQGYEAAIDGLVAAGSLGERTGILLRALLDLFSERRAGGGRAVPVPLEAKGGMLYLGPVPIRPLAPIAGGR